MARNNKKFESRMAKDYSSYSTAGKLFHWANPAVSGGALVLGLFTLLCLSICSFISVLAYSALALVLFGIGSKVYVHLMGLLSKPCKDPLAQLAVLDLNLEHEKVEQWATWAVGQFNGCASDVRSLFLAENLYSSAKLAGLLYLLTRVGCLFNTLTLLGLAWVGSFIFPKVYESNSEAMDELFAKVVEQYRSVDAKVAGLLPGHKHAEPVVAKKD